MLKVIQWKGLKVIQLKVQIDKKLSSKMFSQGKSVPVGSSARLKVIE